MALLDRLIASTSPSAALRRAVRLTEQGDVKQAFPLLTRAARAGIAEAEYRVGRCYLEGAGVPPSLVEGVRWLERAANQGYVDAQARLATLSIHGLATSTGCSGGSAAGSAANLFAANDAAEPDFESGIRWARKAAEAGSADGQAVLGYILTSGPEHLRNLDEAHQWYERSAVAGCPQGALGYALSLARTAKDPEEQAKVAEYLRQAADAGLPTGLYLFAIMTERGLGVPADRPAAIQLFRQAAEKGNRPSQARWGLALMEGHSVAANPTEGESWLRRAALAGDPEAAAVVGDLYAKGGKLPPNYAEAAIWFRRGAEAGHRGAPAPGPAASDRRRRAARFRGGRALVPRLGAGGRSGRPGRPRQPAAAWRRQRGGRGAHPRVVRAGGRVRAIWSRHSISASAWRKASASSATTARQPSGCAVPRMAW